MSNRHALEARLILAWNRLRASGVIDRNATSMGKQNRSRTVTRDNFNKRRTFDVTEAWDVYYNPGDEYAEFDGIRLPPNTAVVIEANTRQGVCYLTQTGGTTLNDGLTAAFAAHMGINL